MVIRASVHCPVYLRIAEIYLPSSTDADVIDLIKGDAVWRMPHLHVERRSY